MAYSFSVQLFSTKHQALDRSLIEYPSLSDSEDIFDYTFRGNFTKILIKMPTQYQKKNANSVNRYSTRVLSRIGRTYPRYQSTNSYSSPTQTFSRSRQMYRYHPYTEQSTLGTSTHYMTRTPRLGDTSRMALINTARHFINATKCIQQQSSSSAQTHRPMPPPSQRSSPHRACRTRSLEKQHTQ